MPTADHVRGESSGAAPAPDELGPSYEAALDGAQRRRTGAFYTPAAIADGLVERAATGFDLAPPRRPTVCDPAVGGGAFALAAARLLERAGHDRATIVTDLVWGADVDGEAVAVARRALEGWAAEAGTQVRASHIVVGDSLASGRALWLDAPASGFDLVVGNPPFLNQLGRATVRPAARARQLRSRLGEPVAPYADAAALFLAESITWLAPAGRLALIVPESLLAARDAGPARAAARADASVVGFWWPGTRVFDAVVDVCAPMLARGAPAGPVRRWFGPGFDSVPRVAPLSPADPTGSWSGLLDRSSASATRAVARMDGAERLGSMVEATAGFRDQFYGLAPHVREQAAVIGAESEVDLARWARLVTVGLIDPFHGRWATTRTRFAGRAWVAPVVDLEAVAQADPRLARWADARLVPKVVLATQTRVLEPLVDTDGAWWPSVPAIAVTPRSGDPGDLWAIAAVLAAPGVSAWAMAHYRGSALSRDALKLSATQVLELPLPVDQAAWADGARLAARAQRQADRADADGWHAALVELGQAMTHAYRSGRTIRDWWVDRLPPWR